MVIYIENAANESQAARTTVEIARFSAVMGPPAAGTVGFGIRHTPALSRLGLKAHDVDGP